MNWSVFFGESNTNEFYSYGMGEFCSTNNRWWVFYNWI